MQQCSRICSKKIKEALFQASPYFLFSCDAVLPVSDFINAEPRGMDARIRPVRRGRPSDSQEAHRTNEPPQGNRFSVTIGVGILKSVPADCALSLRAVCTASTGFLLSVRTCCNCGCAHYRFRHNPVGLRVFCVSFQIGIAVHVRHTITHTHCRIAKLQNHTENALHEPMPTAEIFSALSIGLTHLSGSCIYGGIR